jgi:glycopeptide antibiotics resistance protein
MPGPTLPARALLVAWIAFIVVLSLLPLGAVSGRQPAVWVAIVPFESIGHALGRGLTWATVVSVAGNVAAFVPIGLLAPVAWIRWRSWPAALALGLGVSLGIEVAQLAISVSVGIPYRHADVDDLILNGFGTATGYAAWLGHRAWRGHRRSESSSA